MRIIIAFSIEVRKHFDEERAKESDGERESIIRMRVQKLFVLLCCSKKFLLETILYFSKFLSLRVLLFSQISV